MNSSVADRLLFEATIMELEGTVQNGVIAVDSPAPLPEATKVKIVIQTPSEPSREPNLRERLLNLAGTVNDLPSDMARNQDHYIHGAIHGVPKR